MILLRRESLRWILGAAWLVSIAVGFSAWENYDNTPGDAPGAKEALHRKGMGRWSLVMYAHPHCPCTRASLIELRQLLAENPVEIEVKVLFIRPPGVAPEWERTDCWTMAANIPGVQVECDRDGVESHRAGAKTSGHIELSDPDGRVVFRGGITSARGREGDNLGRQAILTCLRGQAGIERSSPVFGCPLFAPNTCRDERNGLCQPGSAPRETP